MHLVEGPGRELREWASARRQLPAKRVALIQAVRRDVDQEGPRWPAKFFASAAWAENLAHLRVSVPLKRILQSCRTAVDALLAAARARTTRLWASKDPRCALLETLPAIGPITSRVLVGALEEVRRVEDTEAVANSGGLIPTMYQRGGGPSWAASIVMAGLKCGGGCSRVRMRWRE